MFAIIVNLANLAKNIYFYTVIPIGLRNE